MKPYGRLHNVKFPSKTDCHPPKGYVNWWEVAFSKEVSRGGINHRTKQEIAEEYYQQTDFAMDDYENIDMTLPKDNPCIK